MFSFPENVTTSHCFQQMIQSTLQKEPYRRPTSEELKKFEFFVGVSLTRQPSVSFRTSVSVAKDEK